MPKRIHRQNLLFKDHKHLGVAKGVHKVSKECVVAVFAAQVVTNEDIKKQQIQTVGIDEK